MTWLKPRGQGGVVDRMQKTQYVMQESAQSLHPDDTVNITQTLEDPNIFPFVEIIILTQLLVV